MPTFLFGYDVEHLDPDVTRPFLKRAATLHREYGVPATLFVTGETLERNVDALGELVGDPLFDIQQHTYSHTPLKTLVQQNSRGTETSTESPSGISSGRICSTTGAASAATRSSPSPRRCCAKCGSGGSSRCATSTTTSARSRGTRNRWSSRRGAPYWTSGCVV